jgi:FtsH-binding integral membrane protein
MQPAWGAPPAGPPPAQPAPQPGWGAPPPAGAAPSPFGGMPNPMAGAPSPMSGMGAMSGGGTSRDSMGAQATQGVSDRVRFIRLTYLHLFGAILLFAGLEYLLMQPGTAVWDKVSVPILKFSLGDRYNWLVVLAVFGVVSWIADYWASHATSKPMQYVGLGLYVIAEALIFLPLLFLAELQAAEYLAKTGKEAHIIRDAAFLTLAIFGALTASVFLTKKDFSFLRGALAIASGAALVVIVVSILFGFNLGLLFSVAMVILCAGYVLYYTSQVFAHYHTEQYVAASLALFSSIALMFWYVIRILMKLRES